MDRPPTVQLLSAPPGAGKTTALSRLAAAHRAKGGAVCGVLCPDSAPRPEGRRQMVILSRGAVLPLQLNDGQPCPECVGSGCKDMVAEADAYGGREVVTVGNFVFDAAAFAAAEKELGANILAGTLVIIDEVGPLELRRKQGLHQAVCKLLGQRRCVGGSATIIVVVRPSCRAAFLEAYELTEADVEDRTVEQLMTQASASSAM
eukprot:gnl/TRDRNA2_/TRDRNA2_200148_c0_seq1.p1 gnl/TRDRNA2_/TRDRNA2_200148_c0~~gnl/TRDRNA2_/TRDRNA2_200148_c0_seq1.p1  ORF type:complete len:221 (+),score=40.70 gnl/TRDRNA2_/TRDRNA2_200148_c0_seq1:53-664(+)